MVSLICSVSHLERPPQQNQEFKIPAGVYEVWADYETEPEETKLVEIEQVEPKTVQEMIVDTCDEYGVDSDLALAIAKLETGHFTSDAYVYDNNVGGMKEFNTYTMEYETMGFESLEKGVEEFVLCLSECYIKQGLDTPEKMSHKYNPDTPDEWAQVVKELM